MVAAVGRLSFVSAAGISVSLKVRFACDKKKKISDCCCKGQSGAGIIHVNSRSFSTKQWKIDSIMRYICFRIDNVKSIR